MVLYIGTSRSIFLARLLSSCFLLVLFSTKCCNGFQTTTTELQKIPTRPSIPIPPTTTRPLRGTLELLSLSDSSFMESLNSRIQQVKEDKLPLVVLDTMLPRQVLKLRVENGSLFQLLHGRIVNETPFVGITGLAKLKSGQTVYLKYGVEGEITQVTHDSDSSTKKKQKHGTIDKTVANGVTIEFTARRRFKIVENSVQKVETWTEAVVDYLSDTDDEAQIVQQDAKLSLARAMWKAKQLDDLVFEQWIPLARRNERFPGQIDALLQQLGPIPPTLAPTDRSLWVGALINPVPALGVAQEIRPALLTATSPLDRIDVVVEGITTSIRFMEEKQKRGDGK